MNTRQSSMYDLGRQARRAGFETVACNVNNPVSRSYWLAGWHDEDIESGVSRFFQIPRGRVSIKKIDSSDFNNTRQQPAGEENVRK